jgi:hypothetical protein
MPLRVKQKPATVAEARVGFMCVILIMLVIAGTTDWFTHL